MINQENIDRLIEKVGVLTTELTTLQGMLIEVTRTLIQQRDGQGKLTLEKTELTVEEKAKLLEKGTCPDCGGLSFYPGPEGGLSQNLKCVTCGSSFNVCAPFFAERI